MNMILTIVVAAGSGQRMGTAMPKQFLSLGGEPIVMHTLRRLWEGVGRFLTDCSQNMNQTVRNSTDVDNCVHKLVLVLPEEYLSPWQELCRMHDFRVPHEVVAGGDTRFQSVKNGLAAAPEADLVLVHDGVRPFPDDQVMADIIVAAQKHGAAIPVVPVTDSLRRISGPGGTESRAVDRSEYRAVQTPQGFRGDLLRQAYEVAYDARLTDDASVVELSGLGTVVMTQGSETNIKITTPTDLAVAEILWKR